MTGRADYLALGDWNAVCYECGRKRKASMLRRHWQGYYVCPEHWEPRQTQDFVRNVPDGMTAPWAQPVPADIFLPTEWALTTTEPLTLVETQVKAVAMVFSNTLLSGVDVGVPLGDCVLAGEPLAGGGPGAGYTNQITLIETFSIARAAVVNPTDTVSLSESVTLYYMFSNALADRALATSTLG